MDVSSVSNQLLKAHLSFLAPTPRDELLQAIDVGTKPANTDLLVVELSRFAANSIINTFRGAGAEPCTYLGLLFEATQIVGGVSVYQDEKDLIAVDSEPEVGLEFLHMFPSRIDRLEKDLIKALFERIYDSMSIEQRKVFLADVAKKFPDSERSTFGLATATGAMVLANLGGFGTYMLMSSALSTLSLGMLGFGAYTAASSLLSVLLGPIGWAALGAAAVHQLGKPDENKILRAVAAVAMAAQSIPRSTNVVERVAKALQVHVDQCAEERRLDDESVRRRVHDYQKSSGLETLFRSVFLMGEGLIREVSGGVKSVMNNESADAAKRLRESRDYRACLSR